MNTLTPEQLDLLKRLQPKIKEAMGEWQVGDQYHCPICKRDFIFGSRQICMRSLECSENEITCIDHSLFIPKPIDWQNPERGLWGMLKGFKRIAEGTVYGHRANSSVTVEDMYGKHEYFAPTITGAILNALCEQWEVKV